MQIEDIIIDLNIIIDLDIIIIDLDIDFTNSIKMDIIKHINC